MKYVIVVNIESGPFVLEKSAGGGARLFDTIEKADNCARKHDLCNGRYWQVFQWDGHEEYEGLKNAYIQVWP